MAKRGWLPIATTAVIYDLIGRDRASPAFEKAGASASRLEKTVSKVSRTIALAGGAITAGAVAIGVESIKAATSFQASMEKIHTQAGASQKSVESLTKSVLNLGTYAEQSPQQLADAMYHLKSVGLDNANAMKALKVASDLAAVGGADLESTTNALAGAWRSGIKGAQSFTMAASTVNAIVGAGNMKMQDFVDAIGTGILPAARTFGLSLKQVGAALALMTDEGIPAQDAATRLRMSFSLLGAPSAQADKQLQKIGLSGLKLATAMRGPQGIIGALTLLKTHLDKSGLSAAQQSQILSRAFGGGRSSSAILTLLNNLEVLRKKQQQINDTTGRYGSAVAAQRKTAQAQFALLKSSLDVLGVKIGLALLPPVTKFVHFLASTALPAVITFTSRAWHKLAGIIPLDRIKKDAQDAISFISSLFGGLTAKPAKLPNQPAYSAPIGPGGMRRAGLVGALPKPMPAYSAPTGPGGMRTAGLVGALPPVKTAAPKTAAQSLGSTLAKTISGGIDNLNWGKIGSRLASGLVGIFASIGKYGGKIANGLITALGNLDWVNIGKEVGGNAIGFAIGFISSLGSDLFSPSFWKKHWWDAILAVLSLAGVGKVADVLLKFLPEGSKLIGPILKLASKLGKPFEKLVGVVLKGAWAVVRAIGRGFLDGAERVFPGIGSGIENRLGRALGRVVLLGHDMLRWGGDLIGWLRRGIVAAFEKVGQVIGYYIGWMLKPFKDAGSWLWSAGSKLIKGLGRGVSAAARAVGGWMFRYIWKPITGYFAKAGSWLLSKGWDIIKGLGSGIWKQAKMIGTWLFRYVYKPVTSYFNKGMDWLVQHGIDIIQGLGRGIWNRAKSVGGWLYKYIYKPVTGYFAKAGSWLWNHGWNLIKGLFNGIVAKMKGIGNWIQKNVTEPIIHWVMRHFGIKSPSTVFHGIGFNMIAGLIRGIISGDPLGAIKTIFGSVPKALGGLVEHGVISAAKLSGKAISALQGLGSKVLGGLGSALSGAGSGVLSLLGKLFGGGGASGPAVSLGQKMAAALGWTGAQWEALKALWTRESGWRWNATNPTSGAYGIPQSLPASKMASAGADWRTNPATQIRWGLGYIASTYGNPLRAWAHETAYNWYAGGLQPRVFRTPTLIGVGEGTRPERVSVEPLGANYGGGDGAASGGLHIGEVNINHVPGYSTPKDVQNALEIVTRQARLARR